MWRVYVLLLAVVVMLVAAYVFVPTNSDINQPISSGIENLATIDITARGVPLNENETNALRSSTTAIIDTGVMTEEQKSSFVEIMGQKIK